MNQLIISYIICLDQKLELDLTGSQVQNNVHKILMKLGCLDEIIVQSLNRSSLLKIILEIFRHSLFVFINSFYFFSPVIFYYVSVFISFQIVVRDSMGLRLSMDLYFGRLLPVYLDVMRVAERRNRLEVGVSILVGGILN